MEFKINCLGFFVMIGAIMCMSFWSRDLFFLVAIVAFVLGALEMFGVKEMITRIIIAVCGAVLLFGVLWDIIDWGMYVQDLMVLLGGLLVLLAPLLTLMEVIPDE